jgi:hypothetical protein
VEKRAEIDCANIDPCRIGVKKKTGTLAVIHSFLFLSFTFAHTKNEKKGRKKEDMKMLLGGMDREPNSGDKTQLPLQRHSVMPTHFKPFENILCSKHYSESTGLLSG